MEYFQKKYKVYLNQPLLPLLEVKPGMVFPMEISHMASGQRYPYKLSEEQVCILEFSGLVYADAFIDE